MKSDSNIMLVQLLAAILLCMRPISCMEIASEDIQIKSNQLIHSSDMQKERLVALFLKNDADYKEYLKPWYKDMKRLLASYILEGHPLVEVINSYLKSYYCRHMLQIDEPSIFTAGFNAAGDKIVTTSRQRRNAWTGDVPDGNGRDSTARIWDVASGAVFHILEGHASQVCSAHFNVAGDRIVTASIDCTVKIWNMLSGTCLHTLQGHKEAVSSARFNAPGDKIMSVSCDGTVKIWDVADARCLQTIECDNDVVEFNAAGDRLITISNNPDAKIYTVKIWDALSGDFLIMLEGHRKHITSAGFNTAGDRVITASFDCIVKIWDPASGEILRTFPAIPKQIIRRIRRKQREIIWAQFNPAGDRILLRTKRGMPWILDAASGTFLHTLQDHVISAQFNTGGDKIFSASENGTIKIWDIGRFFAVNDWLEKNITLEQALLLNCIYEARITHELMRKRNQAAHFLFDFGLCPHLKVYFETMPPEVQACLERFVTKR